MQHRYPHFLACWIIIWMLMLISTAPKAIAQVVINEVYIHPDETVRSNSMLVQPPCFRNSNDDDFAGRALEWIELYNTSPCQSVDLSCFVLGSNMGMIEGLCNNRDGTPIEGENRAFFTFPAGTVLGPNESLTVGGINSPANITFRLENFVGTPNLTNGSRYFLISIGGWVGLFRPDGAVENAIYWWNQNADEILSRTAYSEPDQIESCGNTRNIPSAFELHEQGLIENAGQTNPQGGTRKNAFFRYPDGFINCWRPGENALGNITPNRPNAPAVPIPSPVFTYTGPHIFCEPTPVSLQAFNPALACSSRWRYRWESPKGNVLTRNSNLDVVIDQDITYFATIEVAGCVYQDSIRFTINEPELTINATNPRPCIDQGATIRYRANGPFSQKNIDTQGGRILTQTDSSYTIAWNTPGTKTIVLSGRVDECPIQRQLQVIVPDTQAIVLAVNQPEICLGDTVDIIILGDRQGLTNLRWQLSNGIILRMLPNGIKVKWDREGLKSISLDSRVGDCPLGGNANVSVVPSPRLDLSSTTKSTCVDQAVRLQLGRTNIEWPEINLFYDGGDAQVNLQGQIDAQWTIPGLKTIIANSVGKRCAAQDTLTIDVVSPTPIAVNTDDDLLCSGDTIQINNTMPILTGTSYRWEITPTTGVSFVISQPKFAKLVFDSPGQYNLQLIAQNGPCANRAKLFIPILQRYTAQVTANKDTVCVGEPVNVVGQHSANLERSELQWLWADAQRQATANPLQQLLRWQTPGTKQVQLLIPTRICTTGDTVQIVVLPAPKLAIVARTGICIGDTLAVEWKGLRDSAVVIQFQSWGNPTSRWIDTLNPNLEQLFWNTIGERRLFVQAAIGKCVDSAQHIVGINERPTIDFRLTPTTICVGDTIPLRYNIQPTRGAILRWDIGNGQETLPRDTISGEDWIKPIRFTQSGPSTIRVQATVRSCTSIAQLPVRVFSYPRIQIKAQITGGCTEDTFGVAFQTPIDSFGTYQWRYLGEIPTIQDSGNVQFLSWKEPGIKTVVAQAFEGNCFRYDTVQFDLRPRPMPVLALASKQACSGESVPIRLRLETAGRRLDRFWSFNGGTLNSSLDTLQWVSWADSGLKIIRLQVVDGPCQVQTLDSLYITPQPQLTIFDTIPAFCYGDTIAIRYSRTRYKGENLTWQPAQDIISLNDSIIRMRFSVPEPQSDSLHHVRLQGFVNIRQCISSNILFGKAYERPRWTALSISPEVCHSDTVQLRFDYQPDTLSNHVMLWVSNATNTMLADRSAFFVSRDTGRISAQLTLSHPLCGLDTTVFVQVNPIVRPIITAQPNEFCQGDSFRFAVQLDPPLTDIEGAATFNNFGYSFNPGLMPESKLFPYADTITVTRSGQFDFLMLVTRKNCQASDTLKIWIKPKPVVDWTDNPISVCQADTLRLLARIRTDSTNAIWQFDQPSSAIQDSLGFRITWPDSGTKRLMVHADRLGCALNIEVRVNSHPKLVLDNSRISACLGDTVPVVLSISPKDAIVVASLGARRVSDSTYVFEEAGDRRYTFSVTLGNCQDSSSMAIRITPYPKLNADTLVRACLGDSLQLAYTVNGTDSTESRWLLPTDIRQLSMTADSLGILGSRAGSFGLILQASNGVCSTAINSRVEILPQPLVDLSARDSIFCTGDSMTIVNRAQPSHLWTTTIRINHPYRWDSTSQRILLDSLLPGRHVIAIDRGNELCATTDSLAIQVIAPPTIRLSTSEPSICVGDTVIVAPVWDIEPGKDAIQIRWLDTLGLVARDTLPLRFLWSWPNAGLKRLTLVSQFGPCIDTTRIGISVDRRPMAELIAAQDSICANDTVILRLGITEPAVVYRWQSDDGEFWPIEGQNNQVQFVPDSNNQAIVQLIAVLDACSAIDRDTIAIKPLPFLQAVGWAPTVCLGDSIRAVLLIPRTITQLDQPINWSWRLRDSVIAAGSSSLDSNTIFRNSWLPIVADTFMLRYDAKSQGCTVADSFLVAVAQKPTIELSPNSLVICAPDTAEVVNIRHQIGITYRWPTEPVHLTPIGNTAGRFTIRLAKQLSQSVVVVASNGLCQAQDTIQMTVYEQPQVRLALENRALCVGDSVRVFNRAPLNPRARYRWQPDSLLVASDSTQARFLLTSNQTQWFSLTATSDSCPAAIDSVSVQVSNYPQFEWLSVVDTVCFGDTIALRYRVSGIGTIQKNWTISGALRIDENDSTIWLRAIRPNLPIQVQVRVWIGDLRCDDLSPIVDIVVLPQPKVALRILAPEDPCGFAEAEVRFSGSYSEQATVNWRTAGGSWHTDLQGRRFLRWPEYGRYMVEVQVAEGRCVATADSMVDFDARFGQLVAGGLPTVFTPNGDGANDFYQWMHFNGHCGTYELAIYDRWGRFVTRLTPENPRWDGLIDGKPAQEGVFVYYIQWRKHNGAQIQTAGTLTLLR
jgi:gliding motility-associated-like protein